MHRFSHASLLLVALVGTCQAATPTTTPITPTPTPTTPQLHDDNATTTDAPTTAHVPQGDGVLQEVSRLLGEMREVAASMQEAREEHGRLAHAVAQISAAVRDMGEHNIHIKKKVRKMSKALNRSSHHHKVKDGLKMLQRDHQRILHAMSASGINVTALRAHNHTHTHNNTHAHNGTHRGHHGEHAHAHRDKKEVTTAAPEASTEDDDEEDEEEEVEWQVEKDMTHTENTIPELVVDPPGPTDPPLPVDCTEVMQRGNFTSGTYYIQPRGLQPMKVWCDQTSSGGGWTLLLARREQPQQLDFDREWNDYKKGFGEAKGEHWIGLEAIHSMVKGRNHELRVNITDWNDGETWAEWKEFSVAGEDKNYRLQVGRYTSSSQAGDALKWHNGMKFSTPDRDNDALLGGHCAKKNNGGWWYRGHRGCYQAHPTGRFQHNPSAPPSTANSRNFDMGPVLVWQNWRGESYYPKSLFLMFRPSLN